MGDAGPMNLSPEQEQEMQDQALAFSRCMREQGVDMPDPQFGGEGQVMLTIGPDGGLDPSDPKFEAAQQACGSGFGPAGAKAGAGLSVGGGRVDGPAGGKGGAIMFGGARGGSSGWGCQVIRRRPGSSAAGGEGARPRRRTLVLTGGAAAVLAGALAIAGLPGGGAKADDGDGPRLATAEVSRRTLVDQQDVDGTLGHGDAVPVVNRRNGPLTWLAPAGSTVDRGEALYEVDGREVPLFFGDRPAWRPLGPGTSGADVKQLKQNLVALGYGPAAGLGPGDAWTAGTTEAVKRWQKAAGLDQKGVVDLGEVVFQPGAVIVSSQSGHPGENAAPGGAVLTATPAATVVTVGLDASKRKWSPRATPSTSSCRAARASPGRWRPSARPPPAAAVTAAATPKCR